jgi:hypothetical protein
MDDGIRAGRLGSKQERLRRYIRGLLVVSCCGAFPATAKCADLYIAPPDEGEMAAMFHSPDEWQQTRRHISGIIRADHSLARIGDQELTFWFQRMKDWQIKLELEVGAIKPWSLKGDKTYEAEDGMWQRLERLGAHISSIAMDGPLAMTLNNLHWPEQYAVDETVKFITLVREHYPTVQIGDIEPFPGLPRSMRVGSTHCRVLWHAKECEVWISIGST